MLNFTWKVFAQTGNIDTYLLYKEILREMEENPETEKEQPANPDVTVS